ncbi:Rne/Rng family ribonuclease [Pedococcus bigeumensis]|uniref:Rne/Rng family ribonuclease n=1 Tax=Pedococcus bigeumensis TaxID=433644 RepID=UPI001F502F90|nr:Rne/Rng family ribonuclease [Pedococcus bigeumensis]
MASNEDLFTADNASQESAAESGESAPAPARKRARRATKKASAPAPVESSDSASSEIAPDAASAPADAASADAESADAPAAAKKPARKAAAKKTAKKATAKKAAPKKAAKAAPSVDDEASPEASADADADLSTDASSDAPPAAAAPRTRSRRASRATAEPVVAEPLEVPEDDAAEDGDAEDVTPEDEAAAEAAAAAAPALGVLFQAPDPTAARPTRRRAATKAAGPPVVAEAASVAEQEQADESTEQDQADETPAPRRRRGRGAKQVSAKQDGGSADAAQDSTGSEDTSQADRAEDSQAGDDDSDGGTDGGRRRRRRGGKGRGRGRGQSDSQFDSEAGTGSDEDDDTSSDGPDSDANDDQGGDGDASSSRRRRRRRRSGSSAEGDDPPGTVTRVRESRRDEPQSVKGSTRLEAKKQRRREGREAGRRRTIITEAEFLARRESVERVMVVREREGRTQIGVLEDNVLVEHYVSRETNASMAGNVYLGRVQNVLPSMEAAFVDIGKGRNAVLYAGEVNWDAAGLENNQPKRIENALKSGDTVLVQVTKDPIGHKGARLTSQISLPGRYLVYVPEGSMTGISRKLPDTERSRLKGILKEVVPDSAGVIVRTAAEGASEEELRADVDRLTKTWDKIKGKADSKGKAKGGSPSLVHGEPDLTVRVIRDVFNEDFTSLVVAGDTAYGEVSDYLGDVAPDLAERLKKWTSEEDLFTHYRVDEQIAKAMDRKVWLPSGGSLVIDRTEAMTVVDVNTGKFVGSGGNLEETVTKNNIEAAEEIVRQLRLRDIGGIIVIDFIDMVLESNRDLVVRRLLECLGRDRTKHQVAEVTSLGLVQMTRKRVGSGLIEVFSENCEHCGGRGIIVHADPVDRPSGGDSRDGRDNRDSGSQGGSGSQGARAGRGRRGRSGSSVPEAEPAPQHTHSGPTPAQIAAAAHAAALKSVGDHHDHAEHDHAEHDHAEHDHAEHEYPEVAQVVAPDSADVAAPQGLDQEQPASAPEPAPEPAPESQRAPEPIRQQAPEPVAAAPKRRKRGRVVAPAGPPRAVPGEADGGPSAAATSDQS